MIRRVPLHEKNPGWMLAFSLTLHFLVFFLCTNATLFRPQIHEATPYYVDLVTLPSAEPSPASQNEVPLTQTSPPAPRAVSPTAKPVMSLPVKTSVTPVPSPANPGLNDNAQAQEARDFAERLRRLEHTSEARHQSAALESLKRKAAASPQSGAPTGTGFNSGSDYGAYIQSRLKDALANTIVYRTRQPETSIHIYIDRQGRLVRSIMITASKDKLFNDSVVRAVEKAKINFPPPPNGKNFDKLYVFSPQEVLGK